MIENVYVVRFQKKIEYDPAWDLQKKLAKEIQKEPEKAYLVLLEHTPVVTLGRNADKKNLKLSAEEFAAKGITVREIERGGDVTYHGPGQLVGYPIMNIKNNSSGIRDYLRKLEEVIIRTVKNFGITGFREKGLTGVWTEAGKIAAIGVSASRWISMHGFALNVASGIHGFETIVPCGISDRAVVSISALSDKEVTLKQVQDTAADCFSEVFNVGEITEIDGEKLLERSDNCL